MSDKDRESVESNRQDRKKDITLKECLRVIQDFKCDLELNSDQSKRWEASVESYMETLAEHKQMLATGKITSIDGYADFRVRNSLSNVFFVMGEKLGRIEISGAAFAHPDVAELIRLYVLCICYVKDVCSFRVEYLHGCLINLIPVIMAQNRIGLQAAFDYANHIIITIRTDILDMEGKIRNNSKLWSPGIAAYVQLLQDYASGSASFGCGTGRFHSVEDYDRKLPIVMKLE